MSQHNLQGHRFLSLFLEDMHRLLWNPVGRLNSCVKTTKIAQRVDGISILTLGLGLIEGFHLTKNRSPALCWKLKKAMMKTFASIFGLVVVGLLLLDLVFSSYLMRPFSQESWPTHGSWRAGTPLEALSPYLKGALHTHQHCLVKSVKKKNTRESSYLSLLWRKSESIWTWPRAFPNLEGIWTYSDWHNY